MPSTTASRLLRRVLSAVAFAAVATTAVAQSAIDTATVDDTVAIVYDTPAVQPLRFGYLSYDYALKAMPGYGEARSSLEALKARYDEEMRRAEEEFNNKYEEFLDGQHDFPQSILQKRQAELQELLEKNIAFREESQRLLKAAEADIMRPLHNRLTAILRTIGEQNGYAFIINTDANACPFVNLSMADDVTLFVIDSFK